MDRIPWAFVICSRTLNEKKLASPERNGSLNIDTCSYDIACFCLIVVVADVLLIVTLDITTKSNIGVYLR